MSRIVKSTRGVISIFVALMLTGILSLGTFVLEAARLQAARTQLTEATASAANSMLSTYNLDLQGRYGLLAMDTLRVSESACADYVAFNSDLGSGYFGNNATRMYQLGDVEMTGVYNLTYPHILKRQLLTVAKYNLPPEASELNMYNVSYVLDDLQTKCQYVADKMDDIQNSYQSGAIELIDPDLRSALTALDKTFGTVKKYNEKQGVVLSSATYDQLPSVTGTVESEIPTSDPQNINALISDASGYLGADAFSLSTESVEVQELNVELDISAMGNVSNYHDAQWVEGNDQDSTVSWYIYELPMAYKELAESVNAAINMLKTDPDGNLLLNSYIALMFSNRKYTATQYVGPGEESTKTGEDMTFARASCEYIFGGDVDETVNQETAYDYMMAIRLIGNLHAIFSASDSLDPEDTYSVAAHLAWAYYETCVDMELLTRYNTPVPLSKERPILRMEDAASVAAAFSGGDLNAGLAALGYYDESNERFFVNGMDNLDYTDSLSLALWLVPNSQKLLRVADLIQLEMRYQQRYVDNVPVTFLMSEQNTYCRVACGAKLNSLLPVLSIGDAEHRMQELPISTVRYAGY